MFSKGLIGFLLILFSSSAFASESFFSESGVVEPCCFVGEKLTYSISYLGLQVGEAVSEVTEKVLVQGREAYHVVVKVKSRRMIDFIFKVRDEHHSYIDVKTLTSLAYHGRVRQGLHRYEEKSEFNFKDQKVTLIESGKTAALDAPKGVQDPVSCGYYFRGLEIQENTSVSIPVAAEGRIWNMEVKTFGKQEEVTLKPGRFETALETQPLVPFRGIFFRRGSIRGLISLDKRRIPLRMTVKIPVLGSVSSELVEYIPGN